MAISQDGKLGPSAESLALAASAFTSQISSWIPANFGQSSSSSSSLSTSQTKPVSNADIVFQAEHERGERLGLGHPLLEVPRHQRRQDTSNSLSTLGKRLGLDAKGKGKGKAEEKGESVDEDEEEEEEESRASIGKKRKVDKVDVWSGRKKAKTKPKVAMPVLAPLDPTTKPSARPQDVTTEPSSDPTSIAAPAVHAASKQSPSAAPNTNLNPELAGLNKNQRKKLRKKQKLLAQQAA